MRLFSNAGKHVDNFLSTVGEKVQNTKITEKISSGFTTAKVFTGSLMIAGGCKLWGLPIVPMPSVNEKTGKPQTPAKVKHS